MGGGKKLRIIPSGAIHAGEYIRPGHWKENFASAMLILAVMSSSICQLFTSTCYSLNIRWISESHEQSLEFSLLLLTGHWSCYAFPYIDSRTVSYHNMLAVEIKP